MEFWFYSYRGGGQGGEAKCVEVVGVEIFTN